MKINCEIVVHNKKIIIRIGESSNKAIGCVVITAAHAVSVQFLGGGTMLGSAVVFCNSCTTAVWSAIKACSSAVEHSISQALVSLPAFNSNCRYFVKMVWNSLP